MLVQRNVHFSDKPALWSVPLLYRAAAVGNALDGGDAHVMANARGALYGIFMHSSYVPRSSSMPHICVLTRHRAFAPLHACSL